MVTNENNNICHALHINKSLCIVALRGKIPTPSEYLETVGPVLKGKESEVYKYLNFRQMDDFKL